VTEIEKGENFFTYIVPVNYCYYVKSEKLYTKDLNIFFGNRKPSEFVMVASQPFDCMLYHENVIPIPPF
jgi:hypothetical protein